MHGAPLPHSRHRSFSRSLRFQWDSTGVSGGCQDIYTVIPNSSATAQNPATCKNVTLPATPLQVDAAVINGAFSEYGWIPQVRWLEIACPRRMSFSYGGLQCTDIQVQAKNGTGPYTLTVRTCY